MKVSKHVEAFTPFLALLTAACTTAAENGQSRIMDEIEARVKLPQGANKLHNYARFYGEVGNGEVLGIYIQPAAIERLAAKECSNITADYESKQVPCIEEAFRRVGAGGRLWVGDYSKVPSASNSGCEEITLVFDTVKKRFLELICAGERPRSH